MPGAAVSGGAAAVANANVAIGANNLTQSLNRSGPSEPIVVPDMPWGFLAVVLAFALVVAALWATGQQPRKK